jgi:hypothetical protein
VLISAVVASLVLAIALRGRARTLRLATLAFVSISATLVIFFIWTQPANSATSNWTVVPDDWEVYVRNGSTPTRRMLW